MPDEVAGVVLYGITSCDQVRRARRWLDDARLPYRFHDLRHDGINAALLQRWLRRTDWESLLNRQSTTWRGLPPEERPKNRAAAERAMLLYPTLIKRPVLENPEALLVGFSEAGYSRLLQSRHGH